MLACTAAFIVAVVVQVTGARAAQSITSWGFTAGGRATPPTGLGAVSALQSGGDHNLALLSDGTVSAWGLTTGGQLNVPAGLSGVADVAVGDGVSMALKSDGAVAVWGGTQVVPAGATNLVAIAGGSNYFIGVKNDGSVMTWTSAGVVTLPGITNAVAVAYGAAASTTGYSLALLDDGTVRGWGPAAATPPAGLSTVVAIAAGNAHGVALKADGTVVTWGSNTEGQQNVPAGLSGVVAIRAFGDSTLALKSNGTIVGWGSSSFGQLSIPVGITNAAVVSLARYHASALRVTDPPVIALAPQGSTIRLGARALLRVRAVGGASYQWYRGASGDTASPVSGAKLPWLLTTPLTATQQFWVRVTNPVGTVDSSAATVAISPEAGLTQQPVDVAAIEGEAVGFSVSAVGTPAPTYRWQRKPAGSSTWSDLDDGGVFAGATSSSLAISDAALAMAGDQYRCTVTNGIGAPVTSNVATLSVSPPLLAWGYDSVSAPIAPPAGLRNSVSISADASASAAVSATGSVAPWGFTSSDATSPAGAARIGKIVKGAGVTLGVTYDGTILAWGTSVATPPALTGVVDVAAGSNHYLALKADGTVVSWGSDSQYYPVPAGLTGVVAISASTFCLALKSDGTVVAWGANTFGQTTLPAGLSNVVAISAGNFFGVAAKSDGTVVTWGANDNGQGNVPAGLTGVVAVAAGNAYALALKNDGTVVGWGAPPSDEIAAPITMKKVGLIAAGSRRYLALQVPAAPRITAQPAPTLILTGTKAALQVDVSGEALSFQWFKGESGDTSQPVPGAIFAGFVTPALTQTTSYWVRVKNRAGSVNSASTTATITTQVASPTISPAGGVFLLSREVALSSATSGAELRYTIDGSTPTESSTLYTGPFALTASGTLRVGAFKAGLVPSANVSADFTIVTEPPTLLASPESASVPTGWQARLVVMAHGGPLTYQWYRGERGDTANPVVTGGTSFSYSPPASATPVSYWVRVTNLAGSTDSAAATVRATTRFDTAKAVAWGDNDYGQSVVPSALSGVFALAGADRHSLALKTDGTVTGWGNNSYSVLTFPSGLAGVRAIAAGFVHNLALKSDGTVVGWGYTASSTTLQFGQRTVPAGLGNVVAIAAGTYHSVALRADGTVVAWGKNVAGESTVPAGLTGVVKIASSEGHTLALKSDGTVVAWGLNDRGQCNVPTGLRAVEISAGGGCSGALLADGSVVVWGSIYNSSTGYFDPASAPAGLGAGWNLENASSTFVLQRRDRTVTAWGASTAIKTIPADLTRAESIAAGSRHALAVLSPTGYGITGTTASTTIPSGTAITLTVTAGGDAPTYQWYRGVRGDPSQPVAGATSATYTTAPLDVASTFWARVTDGSFVEDTATITVAVSGVAPPTISPAGGTFVGAREVVLATVTPGAEIRYTLDGSAPTPASALYAGPLTLTTSATVNARTFLTGETPSSVVSAAFTIIHPPVVVAQPRAQSIVRGARGDVTFFVSGEQVAYQWYRGAVGDTSQPVAGATRARFITPPLDAAAVFWARASNAAWSIDSVLVSVAVTDTVRQLWSWSSATGVPGSPLRYGNIVAVDRGSALDAAGATVRLAAPYPTIGIDPAKAVAAKAHVLVLLENGTVVAYGDNTYGQATPPGVTGVIAVSAGDRHSLALKADGTVVAWGSNAAGQLDVPAGLADVVAISAGDDHSLALRRDGTLVAWGNDTLAQGGVPSGLNNVVAISAGSGVNLVLKADGTAVKWGWNGVIGGPGSREPVAITGIADIAGILAEGTDFFFLKTNGTLVGWRATTQAAFAVAPAISSAVAIASGLAIVDVPVFIATQPTWPEIGNNETATLSVAALGADLSYQWFMGAKGDTTQPVAGGTAATLITPPLGETRTFWVRVSNPAGFADSDSATVKVTVATPSISPAGGGSFAGERVVELACVTPGAEIFYTLNGTVPVNGLGSNYDTGTLYTGPFTLTKSATVTARAFRADMTPSASVAASFAIYVPPVAKVPPRSAIVAAGSRPLLAAGFSGGALTYQWYRGEAGDTSQPVAGATTAFLRVPAITQTTRYWVRATNPVGTADSAAATLTLSSALRSVIAWGLNSSGQTAVASGLEDAVAVAGGSTHSVALRADGTVAAWGESSARNVPSGLGDVVGIAAGTIHSIAVRASGEVVFWKSPNTANPGPSAPITDGVMVSSLVDWDIALRADQTAVSWNGNGVPPGLNELVQVEAGNQHFLVLKADGTVFAWGHEGSSGNFNPLAIPAGLTDVIAIAAGESHNLALKSDGTVVAWGRNLEGQATVPAGLTNVIAIAAGIRHSLALKADGTVVAWGWNEYGQTTIPAGLNNVVAIAAGQNHNLAIRLSTLSIIEQPRSVILDTGNLAELAVSVETAGAPAIYQWYRGERGDITQPVVGAVGRAYVAVATTTLERFWVRATNGVDTVDSNAVDVRLQAARPAIDPRTGPFPAGVPQAFVLTTTTPGAVIRYEDDGDPLTSSSPIYTQPLVYTTSKSVAARAFRGDLADSATLNVNLRFIVAPTITTEPSSNLVLKGGAAGVGVVTTGELLSIVWFKLDAAGVPQVVPGATSAFFTTPSLNETARYFARVSNVAGSVDSRIATIAVVSPEYLNWPGKLMFYPLDRELEFLPDGAWLPDGLPNLMRYAMNLRFDPDAGDLPRSDRLVIDGVAHLTLQYRQRKSLGNVRLVVRRSSDLATWTDVAESQIVALADDDAETSRREARVPIPTAGALFLRLVAEDTP